MSINTIMTLLSRGPWDMKITCQDDKIFLCHYAIMEIVPYFKRAAEFYNQPDSSGQYNFSLPSYDIRVVREYCLQIYLDMPIAIDHVKSAIHDLVVLGDFLGYHTISNTVLRNYVAGLDLDNFINLLVSTHNVGELSIPMCNVYIKEAITRIYAGNLSIEITRAFDPELKALIFDQIIINNKN